MKLYHRKTLKLYKSRAELALCLNCGKTVPGVMPTDCQCRQSERIMAAAEFKRLLELEKSERKKRAS